MPDGEDTIGSSGEGCASCGPNDLRESAQNGRVRVEIPETFMQDRLGSAQSQLAEAMAVAEHFQSQRPGALRAQPSSMRPQTVSTPGFGQSGANSTEGEQSSRPPNFGSNSFTLAETDFANLLGAGPDAANIELPGQTPDRPARGQSFTLAETQYASLLAIGPPANAQNRQLTLADTSAAEVLGLLQEGASGKKVSPPTPRDILYRLAQWLALLRNLRVQRFPRILAKGDGTIPKVPHIPDARPSEHHEIPPHEGERCRGSFIERRIEVARDQDIILWEHEFTSYTKYAAEKKDGAGYDDDAWEKMNNGVRECRASQADAKDAAIGAEENGVFERLASEIENEIDEYGFPAYWANDLITEHISGITCPTPCHRQVEVSGSGTKVRVPREPEVACKEVPVGAPYSAPAWDSRGNPIYKTDEFGNPLQDLRTGELIQDTVMLQKWKVVLRVSLAIHIEYALWVRIRCLD